MGTLGLGGAVEGGVELISGQGLQVIEPSLPPRHFFGRRRGRKLSVRQATLLDAQVDALRLPLRSSVEGGSALKSIFSVAVEEVWLEIGFGAGEHLIQQCVGNPSVGIIGAEPFINGFASLLAGLSEPFSAARDRVRLHNDDVMQVLDWLPDRSITRAFMLFPDPWPKQRQRHRRLFSNALLARLSRVLVPGAEVRFASDIADYVDSTLKLIAGDDAFAIKAVAQSHNRPAPDDWPITRYERKAISAGRTCSYLTFMRR